MSRPRSKMPPRIRVGFLVGKDNDLVEDPKYVGDNSYLADLPSQFRVSPKSNAYLRVGDEPSKGLVHVDVAIAWHIQKHHLDLEVDIIRPEELSLERLRSNGCNYIVGYDAINAAFESPEKLREICDMFRECGNLAPSWGFQEFIYYKSRYMSACVKAGIPTAPTIFAKRGQYTTEQLLEQIRARGWKRFVLKQSFSAFSIGFNRLSIAECEKNPGILKAYFSEHKNCPEFLAQELIEGFTQHWETRVFWFDGQFVYAIANKAAVSTADGQECIVTGDDIPVEFLENAKRIGLEALKVLPPMSDSLGRAAGLPIVRTDIGCSTGNLDDTETRWDPNRLTFFLNEIEYGGTNYFARHIPLDCVPIWSERLAAKARELCPQAADAKRRRLSEPLQASAAGA